MPFFFRGCCTGVDLLPRLECAGGRNDESALPPCSCLWERRSNTGSTPVKHLPRAMTPLAYHSGLVCPSCPAVPLPLRGSRALRKRLAIPSQSEHLSVPSNAFIHRSPSIGAPLLVSAMNSWRTTCGMCGVEGRARLSTTTWGPESVLASRGGGVRGGMCCRRGREAVRLRGWAPPLAAAPCLCAPSFPGLSCPRV